MQETISMGPHQNSHSFVESYCFYGAVTAVFGLSHSCGEEKSDFKLMH